MGNKANISAEHFDFLRSRNFKLLSRIKVNPINNHDSFKLFLLEAVAVINSPWMSNSRYATGRCQGLVTLSHFTWLPVAPPLKGPGKCWLCFMF
jgi:hypothetical protein